MKFTSNGEILIVAKYESAKEQLTVRVIDSGIGIIGEDI